MTRKKVISILTSAIMVFGASVAIAEEYPRYEGVYLKLNNGKFVSIPGVSPLGNLVMYENGRMNSIDDIRVFAENEFLKFPVVRDGSILSIVVNSREHGRVYLENIVELRDMYGQVPNGASAYGSGIGLDGLIKIENLNPFLALNHCGMAESSFRILNISEFITEYEPISQISSEPTGAIFGGCGRSENGIAVFGYSFGVGKNSFPFFLESGVNYFASEYWSGTQTMDSLLRKPVE